MMKDDNEDDLKNKEDLHIGGRHTALDIFRFAVFFLLETEIHVQFLHTKPFLCNIRKLRYLRNKTGFLNRLL